MNAAPLPSRWYYTPAIIIVTGCLVAMVNFGVRSSFGLFTAPISEAHAWPREIFSLALAIQNLVWGIATPLAGALADRYGAARVLMAGSIVYAIGTVGMAVSEAPFAFHAGGGLLVGVGIAFSSFGIVMAALGRIVPPEKRSWSFGIATAASSLGQFVFAPLSGALIAAYGWYVALLLLAASTLLIMPLAVPLSAQKGNVAAGDVAVAPSMRDTIAGAFRHRSYLFLVAGFFVCGFQLAFITVHLPPYLAEKGIGEGFTGLAIGMIGLFNVAGSYVAGVVGGRGSKRMPLSVIYLLRAMAVAVFISFPVTSFTTIVFTATLGLLWLSTVPLTMGLVTVMFGTRYMATLYGFVFLSHQIGSFLGVWLGGRIYDSAGSYDPVWWMSVALGVFAALIHLPISETRNERFAAA